MRYTARVIGYIIPVNHRQVYQRIHPMLDVLYAVERDRKPENFYNLIGFRLLVAEFVR